MLVGDIYGGRDYTSIGLSATTIASSFGKVRAGKALSDPRHVHRIVPASPLHVVPSGNALS